MQRFLTGVGATSQATRPRYAVQLQVLRLTDAPFALKHVFARWRTTHLVHPVAHTTTAAVPVVDTVADWHDTFHFEVSFPVAVSAPENVAESSGDGGSDTLDNGAGIMGLLQVDLPSLELVIEVRLVRPTAIARRGRAVRPAGTVR